ncbi:hypothetical protein AOB60_05220 [Streptomyces noursei]|nr:hypothetical protein AOB60_05220 [Streptomyces noursei]
MTDHRSTEQSAPVLATAVEMLTGRQPVLADARPFMTGGPGRATTNGRSLLLEPGRDRPRVAPDTLIVYEIPPADRTRFEGFQSVLRTTDTATIGGADIVAWRAATDKRRTVRRFAVAGIPHAPTLALDAPSRAEVLDAFAALGRDVWARPTTGVGGEHVFHITGVQRLFEVADFYADLGQSWLLSEDARNVDRRGRRHQLRIVVLGDRVLRVCEHMQNDPDAPCNEARGAVSTLLPAGALSARHSAIAVDATRALGLPFGGVDLAVLGGDCVFEVNVHPVINVEGGLESVALPLVRAHLDRAASGAVDGTVC